MIGEDHFSDGGLLADQESDSEDQSLSVYDAAEIWLSNGIDEDYSFGYSHEELRRAAGD